MNATSPAVPRTGLPYRFGGWRVSRLLPLLVLMVAVLAGCAAPRYATEVRYLPPATEAGQSCLRGCHTDMQACQADCQSRRQSCIAGIEPEVDAAFDQALRQYDAERRVYMRERQYYQLDRAMHFGLYRDPFYYGYPSSFWLTDHYYDDPPVPPEAPSREAIRAAVIDEQCNLDCGCQAAFDQCYVGCGGQIERRVVCVENCDDEAPRSRIPAEPAGGQGGD
ncbi:MAG: hypothetical protein ACOC02_06720 [Guyparkeria sp.]